MSQFFDLIRKMKLNLTSVVGWQRRRVGHVALQRRAGCLMRGALGFRQPLFPLLHAGPTLMRFRVARIVAINSAYLAPESSWRVPCRTLNARGQMPHPLHHPTLNVTTEIPRDTTLYGDSPNLPQLSPNWTLSLSRRPTNECGLIMYNHKQEKKNVSPTT